MATRKRKPGATAPRTTATAKPQARQLYLVSDASGNLIEHLVHALLTQFPADAFQVHSLPFVQSLDDLPARIPAGAILLHAVTAPELKAAIASHAAARRLHACDVTGPTVSFLETASGLNAGADLQRLHQLDTSYMGRMQALEFAMQHDDNRRIERVGDADIVLVGISRVSKSPNALFLAYRGFKVANVAIVPSEGLPPVLRRHRRKNVVALTIQPRRLAEIRGRRLADWALTDHDYLSTRDVIHEVRDAEELYSKRGWPIIDTTNLAVEETSTRILQALNLRPRV